MFDWFAVKCTHKQEILTDDFDDLPVETERKGHVSTIIYNTCFCFINKLLGSTVARWSELLLYSKKVLGFNPPTGWGVACRGASKLLLFFF